MKYNYHNDGSVLYTEPFYAYKQSQKTEETGCMLACKTVYDGL